MKTKEELNALKEEVEAVNKKLAELTEEELEQVTGGKYVRPRVRPREYVPEPPDVEPELPDDIPYEAQQAFPELPRR